MKYLEPAFTKQPPIATAPPIGQLGAFVRWAFVVLVGFVVFLVHVRELAEFPEAIVWSILLEVPGLALSVYLFVNRRTLPVAVAFFGPVAGWLSAAGAGAAMLATFSLATRGKWRELVPNILLTVAFSAIPGPASPGSSFFTVVDFLLLAAVLITFYAIGLAVGFRREKTAAKRDWLRSEDQLQVSRVQEIRALERTAIAREMHDVLAHRISMVALHSGALAYRSDMEPEQVRETAQLINDSARLALKELREVLGTLRSEQTIGDEAEAPQPTLESLPRLWEEANAAVAPVSVTWHGLSPESVNVLQDSTSRNAYRVIQESLTNARKHAPGVPVQVNLGHTDPRFLQISVVNQILPYRYPRAQFQPTDHLSGFGLIGMAERVRSSGGTITAGAQGNQFVVNVSLPWITKEQGL